MRAARMHGYNQPLVLEDIARSRLIQERLGSAPSRRVGRFLS
jgi:hypothetical protein